MTSFKDSFKYYKSKNPPPTLDKVLDFNDLNKINNKIKSVELSDSGGCSEYFGLRATKTWEAFALVEHPGLIFIKNPFSSIGQRYWTVKCLQDYTRKPNKSNLDALNIVPEDKEWWDMCQNNNSKILMDKLRWITLGYHHNWDTKVYSEDNKGIFPLELADLTRYITQVLGFHNFNAEAAIINYYHMDSTLSGHTDQSEQNLEAPLISLSFGQTAIFLIGGKSKDECPSAMFIRSGDIIIMSKESRLCYHGVPKILQIDSRFWNNFEQDSFSSDKHIDAICKDENLWLPFGKYLSHSRININVRQVLKRGQKRLCSDSEKTQ